MKICKVEGCNGKHCAKGLCQKHYYQYKRHGHILEHTRFDKNEIIIDELNDCAYIILTNKEGIEVGRTSISINKIDKVKNIKWHLNQSGYVLNNKYGLLHRYITDAPEGMIVDHKDNDPLNNLEWLKEDYDRVLKLYEQTESVSYVYYCYFFFI